MALSSTSSFGVPSNWIYGSGAYDFPTGSLDRQKALTYLREVTPDYNFSDSDLTILMDGGFLPKEPDFYRVGTGGSTGNDNTTETSPRTVSDDTATTTSSTMTPEEYAELSSSGDNPPPPPPSGDGDVDTSQPVVDPDTGKVNVIGGGTQYPYVDSTTNRFYGMGGSYIDPITGQIQYGSYNAPLYDPNAAFQQREYDYGAGAVPVGSYSDLFPQYLYGSAPSEALVQLDRIGLGLDWVRQNPQQLEQWWSQVFTPLYQNLSGRGSTTSTVSGGGEGMASPFPGSYSTRRLLFGDSDSGQLSDIVPTGSSLSLAFDPNSLLGQVYTDISQLGDIPIGADQFSVDADLVRNLLTDQIGNILIDPTQFGIDSGSVQNALRDQLGNILVNPSQFGLGNEIIQGDTPGSYRVITPQEKLLSDLGIIDVGVDSFQLDPKAASIIRNQLVSGISPLTTGDIQYDAGRIAGDIRGDITSAIDPINRADLGLTDAAIAELLSPLRSEISRLPTDFSAGAGAELGRILSGFENRLGDIESFSAGDQFLRPETKAAQQLLDILYGTSGGSGPSAGIAGFQAPASIGELATQLGTFGPSASGVAGQVQALQEALGGLDFSALTDIPDFSQLTTDLGNLNNLTQGGVQNLGALRSALGGFSPEDQAIMGMLLNLLGPEGVSNLSTSELSTLIERFKQMQGGALTDSLTGYFEENPLVGGASKEDLTSALRGYFNDNPITMPEIPAFPDLSQYFGEGSSLDTRLNGISEILRQLQDDPATGPSLDDITEAIREEISRIGGGAMPSGSTGAGGTGTTSTGSPDTSGFLRVLEDSLRGQIRDQDDITADYLRQDPITASLLADLEESQRQQTDSLQEQLQRFGVISSGDALQALPELASAQRREELGVLSDAAQRIQGQRTDALTQGLDLGKMLSSRQLGLGELLGTVEGQQTLPSRQADLDILAAAIAALDPALEIDTKDPAQKDLAAILLRLLQNNDDALLGELGRTLGLR